MNIQFINCKQWGINEESLRKCAKKAKKFVPKKKGELNVIFIDNPFIHELNKKYRNCDSPTDVLSFSYLNFIDIKESGLIGEIYISVPTAKKQAKEYQHSLTDELKKLFVHGFLHIFGYEHDTDEGYKKMTDMEEKIITQ